MMVEINADKEEAEVVRVKVEAEEATANEKVCTMDLEPTTRGSKWRAYITIGSHVGRPNIYFSERHFP